MVRSPESNLGLNGMGPWDFRGTKIPEFIIFQDAHGYFPSQKKLSEIISQLEGEESRSRTLVAVEGAWGRLDLSFWNDVPQGMRARWADNGLRQGWITGEEHALLGMADRPLFFGVDDPVLHKENSFARQQVERDGGRLASRLRGVEERFLANIQSRLSPRTREWMSLWDDYDGHRADEKRLAARTMSLVGREVMEKKFPQLFVLATLQSMEEAVHNIRSVPPEMSRIESLKRETEGVVHSLQQLDIERLNSEIENLRLEGCGQTSSSSPPYPTEKNLILSRDRLKLLIKLLELNLTPSDWSRYQDMSITSPPMEFLSTLGGQGPGFIKAEGDRTFSDNDQELIKQAESYFHLALSRNKQLAENALRTGIREKAERVILIVGGFHTSGISAVLRDYGVPFEVFTPLGDSPSGTLRNESRMNSPGGVVVLLALLAALNAFSVTDGPSLPPERLSPLLRGTSISAPLSLPGQEAVLMSIRQGSNWNKKPLPLVLVQQKGEYHVSTGVEAREWARLNAGGIDRNSLERSFGEKNTELFFPNPSGNILSPRLTRIVFVITALAGMILLTIVGFQTESIVMPELGRFFDVFPFQPVYLMATVPIAGVAGGSPSKSIPTSAAGDRATSPEPPLDPIKDPVSSIEKLLSVEDGAPAAQYYIGLKSREERSVFVRAIGPINAGRLFCALSEYGSMEYMRHLGKMSEELIKIMSIRFDYSFIPIWELMDMELRKLKMDPCLPNDMNFPASLKTMVEDRARELESAKKILGNPHDPKFDRMEVDSISTLDDRVFPSTANLVFNFSLRKLHTDDNSIYDLACFFFPGLPQPLGVYLNEMRADLLGIEGSPRKKREHVAQFDETWKAARWVHLSSLDGPLLPVDRLDNRWKGRQTPLRLYPDFLNSLNRLFEEGMNHPSVPMALVEVSSIEEKWMLLEELSQLGTERGRRLMILRPQNNPKDFEDILFEIVRKASYVEGAVLVLDMDTLSDHIGIDRSKRVLTQFLPVWRRRSERQGVPPTPLLLITSQNFEGGGVNPPLVLRFQPDGNTIKGTINMELTLLEERYGVRFDSKVLDSVNAAMIDHSHLTIGRVLGVLQMCAANAIHSGQTITINELTPYLEALVSDKRVPLATRVQMASAKFPQAVGRSLRQLYSTLRRALQDSEGDRLEARLEHLLRLAHLFSPPHPDGAPLNAAQINRDLQTMKAKLEGLFPGAEALIDVMVETYGRAHLERRNNPAKRGRDPNLCLVGDPGTVKTSIVIELAKLLGGVVIKLQGSNLRTADTVSGMDHTYVGATPGDIVLGLQRPGRVYFVLIDEINAIDSKEVLDALLEVLNEDHFIDKNLGTEFPIPLRGGGAEVYFVATSNDMTALQSNPLFAPLMDRLKIVPVRRYQKDDVVKIGATKLFPRASSRMPQIGLDPWALSRIIIERYLISQPYSIRELLRLFEKIVGYRLLDSLTQPSGDKPNLNRFVQRSLGPPLPAPDTPPPPSLPGHSTGLVVVGDGGDIMPIQTSISLGAGGVEVTGLSRETMTESAQLVRNIMDHLLEQPAEQRPAYLDGVRENLRERDVHIHLPNYSMIKDGPSAGVAFFISVVGALTNRKPKPNVAMTGAVNIHGDVLKIGGLLQKARAAQAARCSTVIIPSSNLSQLLDAFKVDRSLMGRILWTDGTEGLFLSAVTPPQKEALGHLTIEHYPFGVMVRGVANDVHVWETGNSIPSPSMTYALVGNLDEVVDLALEPNTAESVGSHGYLFEIGSIAFFFLYLLSYFACPFFEIDISTLTEWLMTNPEYLAVGMMGVPLPSEPRPVRRRGDLPVKKDTDDDSLKAEHIRLLSKGQVSEFAMYLLYHMTHHPRVFGRYLAGIVRMARSFTTRRGDGFDRTTWRENPQPSVLEEAFARAIADPRGVWSDLYACLFDARTAASLCLNEDFRKKDTTGLEILATLRTMHTSFKTLSIWNSSEKESSESIPGVKDRVNKDKVFIDSVVGELESLIPAEGGSASSRYFPNRLIEYAKRRLQGLGQGQVQELDTAKMETLSRNVIEWCDNKIIDLSVRKEDPGKFRFTLTDDLELANRSEKHRRRNHLVKTSLLHGVEFLRRMLRLLDVWDLIWNPKPKFLLEDLTLQCTEKRSMDLGLPPQIEGVLFPTLERDGPRVLRITCPSQRFRAHLPSTVAHALLSPRAPPFGQTSIVFKPPLADFLPSKNPSDIGLIINYLTELARRARAILVIDADELAGLLGRNNDSALRMILDTAEGPSLDPALPVIIVSSPIQDTHNMNAVQVYSLAPSVEYVLGSDPMSAIVQRSAAAINTTVDGGTLKDIYGMVRSGSDMDLAISYIERQIGKGTKDSGYPSPEISVQGYIDYRSENRSTMSPLDRFGELVANIPDEYARSLGYMALATLRTAQDGTKEAGRARNLLEVLTGWPYEQTPLDRKGFMDKDAFIRDRLDQAQTIMDDAMWGAENVKDQILVMLLKYLDDMWEGRKPDPIRIALVGNPGSGKTQLGKIIAQVFDVPFVEIPLGGTNNRQYLTGHHRGYLGAKPGEIVRRIIEKKTRSLVVLLDELGKFGKVDIGLSIFDPDQLFVCGYSGASYDLSGTIMIATYNLGDPMPPAIRDRVTVMRLDPPDRRGLIDAATRLKLPNLLEKMGIPLELFGSVEERRAILEKVIYGYMEEISYRKLDEILATLLNAIKRDEKYVKWKLEQDLIGIHGTSNQGTFADAVDRYVSSDMAVPIGDFFTRGKISFQERRLTSFNITPEDIPSYLGPMTRIGVTTGAHPRPGDTISMGLNGEAVGVHSIGGKAQEFTLSFPPARGDIGVESGKVVDRMLQTRGQTETFGMIDLLVRRLVNPNTLAGKKVTLTTDPSNPVGGHIAHAALMSVLSTLSGKVFPVRTLFLGELDREGSVLPLPRLGQQLSGISNMGSPGQPIRVHLSLRNLDALTYGLASLVSMGGWGPIEYPDGTMRLVFPAVPLRAQSESARTMAELRESALSQMTAYNLSSDDDVFDGMLSSFSIRGTSGDMVRFIMERNMLPYITAHYRLFSGVRESYKAALDPSPFEPLPSPPLHHSEQSGRTNTTFLAVIAGGIISAQWLLPLVSPLPPILIAILAGVGFLMFHAARKAFALKFDPLSKLSSAGDLVRFSQWADGLDIREKNLARKWIEILKKGQLTKTQESLARGEGLHTLLSRYVSETNNSTSPVPPISSALNGITSELKTSKLLNAGA